MGSMDMVISEQDFKSTVGNWMSHIKVGLEISTTLKKGVWIVTDTFIGRGEGQTTLFKGGFDEAYAFFTQKLSPNIPFPSSHVFHISAYAPLVGQEVIIWTNWKAYRAKLIPSEFGGVVFSVLGSTHTVELTTVKGWMPV